MAKGKQDPENDQKLEQLAQQIRSGHTHCLKSFRTGLEHARTTGTLLIEAKGLVRRGRWQAWVDEHCKFDVRMAQNYMLIAEHYDAAVRQAGSAEQLTMTGVLRAIKGLKGREAVPAREEGGREPAFLLHEEGYERKRREMKRLRAEGKLTSEHDAKLAGFLDERLAALYAWVRRIAEKELPSLEVEGLDAAHLAIALLDQLKDNLDAARLFTPPQPPAAEEEPAIAAVLAPVPPPAPAPAAAPTPVPMAAHRHDGHSGNGKPVLATAGV